MLAIKLIVFCDYEMVSSAAEWVCVLGLTLGKLRCKVILQSSYSNGAPSISNLMLNIAQ